MSPEPTQRPTLAAVVDMLKVSQRVVLRVTLQLVVPGSPEMEQAGPINRHLKGQAHQFT
jgi:hypothetical protein